jgi:hypothetical protein
MMVRSVLAVRDSNQRLADFLLTDAQVGQTLLDVACTTTDPAHAHSTVAQARLALETIDRYRKKLSVDAVLDNAIAIARAKLLVRLIDVEYRLATGGAAGRLSEGDVVAR